MKLYKFRPLASAQDLKYIKEILETGRFWHSNFSQFNDVREGGFTIFPNNEVVDQKIIDLIYNDKNQYRICSFSNEQAFKNPVMWGHYANGFKGLVIEIEVEDGSVNKVKYVKDLYHVKNYLSCDKNTKNILTRKFKPWQYEEEYRSLIKTNENQNPYRVGEIESVLFGDPYRNAENYSSILSNNDALVEYNEKKNKLIDIIKAKNYKFSHVVVDSCGVVAKQDGFNI